ncbi:MAG: CHAT domain-containing protein [Coleofasciculaceae cyanobacterium]
MNFAGRHYVGWLSLAVFLGIAGLDTNRHTQAQTLTPSADGNTIITPAPQNPATYNILGGTLSGDRLNLFHSFQEFNLNSGQTANFQSNPTIQNILGRVTGGNPSLINGLIQVTGGNSNLFLMNPAGIIFGTNAQLNLPASFTATTATGIGFDGNNWFNATGSNNYQNFNGTPNLFAFDNAQSGTIINAGFLAVRQQQNLTLIGGNVINTGQLKAPSGTISLTAVPAANLVRISQTGSLLNLEITPPRIDGQNVSINPLDLPTLLTGASPNIETRLSVSPSGVQLSSGISIPTTPGTAIAGTINTSNPLAGRRGGAVNVFGDKVGLFNSTINTSGANGGGNVRIGGDYQGNGLVPNASQTLISDDSSINANAIRQGDGGQVVVWSDQLTRFYGSISSRGGATSGNGGLIEASGKELLVFTGSVDAAAPNGQPGTLLLDPKNITIQDPSSPLVTFLNPTPTSGENFGFSIAAVGTNVLIGAPNASPGGVANAGLAYLFDNTGVLLQTFSKPTAPVANEQFGFSVAALGTDVLIGAPFDNTAASESGAVYLFNGTTGALLNTLTTPTAELGAGFGWSVAGVGNNILVGAPFTLSPGGGIFQAGSAYLFDGTTNALLQTFNNPTPGVSDQFGYSVSGLGANVLIGAPYKDVGGLIDVGSAYIFDSTTGALSQTLDNPTPAASDFFGWSVAGVGTNALVGALGDSTGAVNAGSAYLFDGTTGALQQTFNNPNPGVGDFFGRSVAAVGSNVLIGAHSADIGAANAGAAYLFDGTTGVLQQTFVNPNGTTGAGNEFGWAVAAAGTNVLISSHFDNIAAPTAGAAYIYDLNGNLRPLSFTDNPSQSLAISPSAITAITNTGTNVILQANNDITVNQAITSNRLIGASGGLTMQAGRSILLNANITTDDGNLTLVGNETAANGVINAFRDPGNAVISFAPGVTLNSGRGLTTITLNTGAGLTNNTSGNITLGNITAGGLVVTNNGPNNGNINAVGTLNTSSATGSGGNVTLSAAGGGITTAAINTRGTNLTGGNNIIRGGEVNITSGRNLTTGIIDAGASGTTPQTSGGNIRLTSSGTVTTANLNTSASQGGNVNVTAAGNIATGSVNAGATNSVSNGGSIVLGSQGGAVATGDLNASGSNGGVVSVTSRGNIATGGINTGGTGTQGNGGNTILSSQNGTVTAANLNTSGSKGGDINVTAAGNVATGSLNAVGTGVQTSGGNIALSSQDGSIRAANLNASGSIGGGINLGAKTQITAGQLNTTGNAGSAGNIRVEAEGNLLLNSINAQGTTTGGTVNIKTPEFFQVTESFLAANGTTASISSVGGGSGGAITIQHGGKGLIPFDVGNSAVNGTSGAITSGQQTVTPVQSFPYTESIGNISFISVDRPPNPIKPIRPINPNLPFNLSNLGINPVDLTQSQTQLETTSVLQGNKPTSSSSEMKIDSAFSADFTRYFGLKQVEGVSLADALNSLRQVQSETGVKAAFVYAMFVPQSITTVPSATEKPSQGATDASQSSVLRSQTRQDSDRLELVLITPEGKPIRHSINATRAQVTELANDFLSNVTNVRNTKGYLAPAQKMYQLILAPLEKDLQQQGIQNLVYIMDSRLRSIPLAALHDGKGFVVERYSFGLMPSLALTNTSYKDVSKLKVLAMGADTFSEQKPLPAVPVELSTIANKLWPGKSFLNQDFTIKNLKAVRSEQRYGIIHLATHAEFLPGKPSNSYIQLWDTKLRLDQLPLLGLNKPPVELLVLSACRTALGDEGAELGFAGLAIQAGVKSALGSLWYVSDDGTFGLMTEFYEQLKESPIKSEALRLAQLAMIKGEVRLQGGKLVTTNGNFTLPSNLEQLRDRNLSHPYYWSSFTMIGNPW